MPLSNETLRGVVQIVGYQTAASTDERAALLLADDGVVDTVPLEAGTTVEFGLGNRHCAGVLGDRHVPCANEPAPYCEVHTETWVCAICTGTCLKDEMDCFEEHAIYLAAFAPDTIKVGVTKAWRLETRLREQGADRAALLEVVPDGRIAREKEAQIALSLTDRVRVSTKIDSLHRDVDETAWHTVLDVYDSLEEFSFEYGFNLVDRPLPATIATGTVIGTKGRILVVERAGSTYAIDLRDLVGYRVEADGTDRDLQASLGAFP